MKAFQSKAFRRKLNSFKREIVVKTNSFLNKKQWKYILAKPIVRCVHKNRRNG